MEEEPVVVIDIHVHIRPGMSDEEHRALADYCRRGGVGMVLVSSVGNFQRYPEPDVVRASNDACAAFVSVAGDFARWLAYLNPQHDDWREELDRCLDLGAIGIKLWVALHDEERGLDRTHEVVAHAGATGLAVLIHTFNHTGGNEIGEVNISEFAELAAASPDTRLVAAHAGGNWCLTVGVLCGLPNAHVDVCGSYPSRGMVETLVADLGADRVLFGTDMPGRSLPSQLAKVMLADVSDDDREQILGGNAARVFGLDCASTQPAEPALHPATVTEPDVDHFCFCGDWPFFPSPCPGPAQLQAALEGHGVRMAYAADLGSVFRLDLEAANRGFVESCDGSDRIAPLAVVNPCATNWPAVLDAVPDAAAGILASPYLHNWSLCDEAPMALFAACAQASRAIWVNCAFGDHRFRHTAMAYRPVTREDLAAFLETAPPNAYVLQGVGWGSLSPVADILRSRGDVRVEVSRLTDLHRNMDAALAAGLGDRLVMGSEFPLRHMDEVRWAAERL